MTNMKRFFDDQCRDLESAESAIRLLQLRRMTSRVVTVGDDHDATNEAIRDLRQRAAAIKHSIGVTSSLNCWDDWG